MKLQIMSDLHLEGRAYDPPQADQDTILILAGDIQVGINSAPRLLAWARHARATIYVPGNHEYYGRDKDQVDRVWEELARPYVDFHYLPRGSVEIDGIKFVCASFWPNCWDSKLHQEISKQVISDYRVIKKGDRVWTPEDAELEHIRDRNFLAQNIDPDCVVVTHWPPIKECIDPKFTGNELNSYFVNNNPELFWPKPKLWVCGHTHYAVDFNYDATRVINNPRGYAKEAPNFDPNLRIEI